MTEEETNQFTDVMVEKAVLGHGFSNGRYQWGDDPQEALRGLIFNVIVDTDLLVSGAVPLSRWKEAASG